MQTASVVLKPVHPGKSRAAWCAWRVVQCGERRIFVRDSRGCVALALGLPGFREDTSTGFMLLRYPVITCIIINTIKAAPVITASVTDRWTDTAFSAILLLDLNEWQETRWEENKNHSVALNKNYSNISTLSTCVIWVNWLEFLEILLQMECLVGY